MKSATDRYVVSFEAEPFHQEKRYHWLISAAQKPDTLVSWGYAPTQELAEQAAQNELLDLSSGKSEGGWVAESVDRRSGEPK